MLVIFYLSVTAVVLVGVSWLGIRSLIPYLNKQNMLDVPNARSLHQRQIPCGGGVIIVAVVIFMCIAMAIYTGRLSMFLFIAFVVACWGILGWMDDRLDLPWWQRLIAQALLAMLSVAALGSLQSISVLPLFVLKFGLFASLFSLVFILWLSNLYNFMDGMDGLAAAQAVIAATVCSFWFWNYGDQALALVALSLAAASYGFLLWNWHPAKIFMGDVGSITIGACFSIFTLIGHVRYQFPLLSFVLLLGVFIADASVTMMLRISRREKPWQAHRSHYYQRLAAIGISHQRIVLIYTLLMAIFSLLASINLIYPQWSLAIAMCAVLLLSICAIIASRLELNHADQRS